MLVRGMPTIEKPLLKSYDEVAQDAFNLSSTEVLKTMQDELNADLLKAMGSNSIVGGGGLGDLGPLRLEDLDATMTKVLYDKSHFVMQRWIQREAADQLVYQYNVQHSYGNSRGQSGFREGGGPGGSISTFSRETATIRFFGIEGGISQQASLMKKGMQLDPMAKENEDRTIDLLSNVERQLIWGDEALTDPDGNIVAYDGLVKQIRTRAPEENVIDMRGAPFDLDILNDVGLIYHDYRYTSDFSKIKMFAPGQVFTDIAKTQDENDRRILGGRGSQPEGGYVPGSPVQGYLTQFGYIPFQPSVFMQPTPGGKPVAYARDAFGAATTIVSAVASADATATSKIEAGTFYYFVAALYDSGESLVSAGVSVTPTAGQKVVVTINRTTQVDRVRGYRLYRGTSSNSAKAGFIANVPDNVGTISFTDRNDVLPNTNIALILENSTENLMIAQLAPLMRFAQPVYRTMLPFYYLLYHTLLVKAPSRMFLIRNIGKA